MVRHLGPFGIGHEAIAQDTAIGDNVTGMKVGYIVVVPF